MVKIELLLKAIILLINEYKLTGKNESIDLIKVLLAELEQDKNKAKVYNDDNDLINTLKDLLNDIIKNEIVPNEELLVNIEMILTKKPSLFKIVDKYSKKTSNLIITNLKNDINKSLTRIKVNKILKLNFNRSLNPLSDPNVIMADLLKFIEDNYNNNKTSGKSLAITDTINFKDKESVISAAKKAVELISGSTVLKTSWENLNRAIQGGFRRGQTVSIAALPHNYKSSLTKTIFLQIAMENTPVRVIDIKNSKPLLLFISLEEEVDNIMFFFYTYLKFSLDNVIIKKEDQKNLDPEEVSTYVYDVIEKTGFNIEVMRVRPDLFNITEFEKTINYYENNGFEIYGVFLDYAKKMSRKGLEVGGIAGANLLELFSLMRNITSSKNILFLTPHQLSTAAKQLLKNGLPDDEFVQYINGKGYYAESGALDTELDLELFIHLIKRRGKKTRLSIQVGKNRIPTTIPEEDKYLELEFSNKLCPLPAPSDIHKDVCVNLSEENEDDFES